MTALMRTAEITGAPPVREPAHSSADVHDEMLSDICVRLIVRPSDIEKEWLSLEQNGLASVFQSYAWCSALWNGTAQAFGEEPLLFAGYSANGDLAFVWPMAVQRKFGTKVLNWLGSWGSTANFGVYSRAAAKATPQQVRGWFKQILRLRRDIGAVELTAQPASWEGVANPIVRALASRPSEECERVAPLSGDFKIFYETRFSSDRRARNRRYERKLAELGAYEIREAASAEEKRQWLDAFLAQKLAQLERHRSPTIFENPAIRDFLQSLAAIDSKTFAVDVLGMTINGEVVATRWGFNFKDRFYAYGESIADGPARQRSPGTLITIASFAHEFKKGTVTYDLGPGPGDHKDVWGPVDTPLFNSWMINSVSGALPVAKTVLRDVLKHEARARPKLLETWRQARTKVRGLLSKPPRASS